MKHSTIKSIRDIPCSPEGWWKSSSEKGFRAIAEQLVDKGFTEEEAVDILENAYYCVADCFGC